VDNPEDRTCSKSSNFFFLIFGSIAVFIVIVVVVTVAYRRRKRSIHLRDSMTSRLLSEIKDPLYHGY
jgi:sensor domain CHASE-containing protein